MAWAQQWLVHFHQQDFEVIAIARNPEKNPRLAILGVTTPSCACDRQATSEKDGG
ncbi:hypothetical protein OH492_29310 [Vibrio chagasii]|nr:hypothetical protein [Vibrio chagasii]